MRKNIGILTILLTICIFLGAFPIVFAAEEQEEFTLQEITVTAEKRTQNLQKVAMSMEVVQGENLKVQGTVSLEDILKDIPNVSTNNLGGLGSTINIRGLGQDLPVGEGEAAVSTNYDGISQMRPDAQVFGNFDIDRVEVLRGPQGTLYGRNSTGGVVNVISKKPSTEKIEGYVGLELAQYKKVNAEGAINVPITDKFAGRISFITTKQMSYTQDIMGNSDIMDGLGYRIQLLYKPSDVVSLNLQYNSTQRTGNLATSTSKTNYDAGNYYLNNSSTPYSRTSVARTDMGKIQLNADITTGPGIATIIGSSQRTKNRTSSWSQQTNALSEGGNPWDMLEKAVEMRYSNKSDSKIQWLIGTYYYTLNQALFPRTSRYTNKPGENAYWRYKTESAFGQITYPFTDTFRVILGGRYTKDQKGYYDTWGPTLVVPYPAADNFKFNYSDWKVGMEQDLTEDKMIYFNVSTGHRPGGFNGRTLQTFGIEKNMSYEVGSKNRFLDNRLQVNGAIFYYQYEGYQVVDQWFAIDADYPLGTVYANFFNIPKARTIGGELDVQALMGDATSWTMSLAYLKNQYQSDFYIHETVYSSPTNMNGKTMPHSPKFSLKSSLSHNFYFSDGSSLTPTVSYRWTSKQYMGIQLVPLTLVQSTGILDARVSYNTSKSWYINVYCNNVLDKPYVIGGQLTSRAGQGGANYRMGAPRTIGVTGNFKF